MTFFSEDISSLHDSLGIRICRSDDSVPGWGDDGKIDHFYIHLKDLGNGGNATIDQVTLLSRFGPKHAAIYGFVHEFQHVVDKAFGYRALDSVTLLDGDYWGFSELMSKYAEFRIGGHQVSSDIVSPLYDLSILGYASFKERCTYYPSSEGCERGSNPKHYLTWGVFSAYLENAFGKHADLRDDLLHKWIRDTDELGGGSFQYNHDLSGLANALADFPSDLFPEQESTIRVNEVMHKFALAQFVNKSGSLADNELLFQWYNNDGCGCDDENCFRAHHCDSLEQADLWRPQEKYGLFRGAVDGVCFNDVKQIPFYHHVATGEIHSVGGFVCSHDIWPGQGGGGGACESDCDADQVHGSAQKSRYVEVSEYASNYLVFAPDSAFTDQELIVQIAPSYTYECYDRQNCETPITILADDLSQHVLFIDVVGYIGAGSIDEYSRPLDELGEYAEIFNASSDSMNLAQRIVAPTPGESYEVRIPGFGRAAGNYDAVLVAMTLAALVPSPRVNTSIIKSMPYSYTYFIDVPDQEKTYVNGDLAGGARWEANSILWSDSSITVPAGDTLTIEEGVHLIIESADWSLVNKGVVNAEGSYGNKIYFEASQESGFPAYWQSVQTDSAAVSQFDQVLFLGLRQFTKERESDLTLSNCLLHFDRDPSSWMLLEAVASDSNSIASSLIIDVSNARAENITLSGVDLRQDPDVRTYSYFAGFPPLLRLGEGDNYVDDSVLTFTETGISVSQNARSDTTRLFIRGSAAGACAIKGYDLVLDPVSTAIKCKDGGKVVVDNIVIDTVHCAAEITGGMFSMEHSYVQFEDEGIVASGSTVSVSLEDSNTIKSYDDGDKCEGEPDGPDCIAVPADEGGVKPRIIYTGLDSLFARRNNWGKCVCGDEYFLGNAGLIVWSNPLDVNCCVGPGGGFAVIGNDAPAGRTSGVFPTPFSKKVAIEYSLGQDRETDDIYLAIYSISGRKVRSHVARNVNSLSFEWDGKDNRGKALAAGVYLVRVGSENKFHTHKVVLLK